jgi:hypothetical protein
MKANRNYVKVRAVSDEIYGDTGRMRANCLTKPQAQIIEDCNDAIQGILEIYKEVL